MTNDYLKYLKEQVRMGRGLGKGSGRFQGPGKKNAPCFAYETVYNKPCPQSRYGRYPGKVKEKPWGEYYVDEHLDDKWLKELNSINKIEIRSMCEGHDKDWVSYIIFRIKKEPDDDEANKIIKRLNKGITKAAYNIGNMGRRRFIVTAKLWYGQPDWEHWWDTLADHIKKNI